MAAYSCTLQGALQVHRRRRLEMLLLGHRISDNLQ